MMREEDCEHIGGDVDVIPPIKKRARNARPNDWKREMYDGMIFETKHTRWLSSGLVSKSCSCVSRRKGIECPAHITVILDGDRRTIG